LKTGTGIGNEIEKIHTFLVSKYKKRLIKELK
jgi:hypothetical protein